MTEENTSVVQELDKTGTQVDPKETAAAATEKVGEEADPQGTQEQGEKEQDQKRAGGWQRRQWKAERRAEEAEAREAYWREKALGTEKPEAKVEAAKPEPVWAEYEAAGKSEQYFKDLAKWTAAEQLRAYKEEQKAEAQQRETQTEQTKAQQRFDESAAKVKEQHPDFDQVLKQAHPSPLLSSVVFRSKDAAAVAYHLATNPDEEDRLSELTDPVEIAQEIGFIRAQLAQPSQAAEEVTEPPISKAPKPITPVSKSSPAKSDDIHDPKLPWKRFVALREAELAKRK